MAKLFPSPLMYYTSRLFVVVFIIIIIVVVFRGFCCGGGWSQLLSHAFSPGHAHPFATPTVIRGFLLVVVVIIVVIRGWVIVGKSFLNIWLQIQIQIQARERTARDAVRHVHEKPLSSYWPPFLRVPRNRRPSILTMMMDSRID
jgi:hypothetical protein